MKVKISKLHYGNVRDSLIMGPLFFLIILLFSFSDRKFLFFIPIDAILSYRLFSVTSGSKLAGVVTIDKSTIFSSRLRRKRCEINCSRTVHYCFFRGVVKHQTSRGSAYCPEGKDGTRFHNLGARFYNVVDEDYILISHEEIPDCTSESLLLDYDESTQIVLPYTEEVKQALSPYLSRFNWVWDGGEPTPPTEPIPPSPPPEGIPPFTGRWNSRF